MSSYKITPVLPGTTTFIEIENDAQMRVTLSTFGASLFNLEVRDENGVYVPLVLSNETVEDFNMNPQYFGKSVGRVAGRISFGQWTLGGKKYAFEINNNRHTLHGGFHGFSFQTFAYEVQEDEQEIRVAFGYFSKDKEAGYPGNLTVSILYRVAKHSQTLTVDYHALSDQDTLVNLTNHSYFNLSGDVSRPVLDHILTINASCYTNVDDEIIVRSVDPVTSVMDFRNGKRVGQDLFDPSIYQTGAKGYDHCFMLDTKTKEEAALTLVEPVSKRRMHVYTTYPAVVVYSDNYPRPYLLQGGVQEVPHAGLAIETQYSPSDIAGMILKKGTPYFHQTRYVFDRLD